MDCFYLKKAHSADTSVTKKKNEKNEKKKNSPKFRLILSAFDATIL